MTPSHAISASSGSWHTLSKQAQARVEKGDTPDSLEAINVETRLFKVQVVKWLDLDFQCKVKTNVLAFQTY